MNKIQKLLNKFVNILRVEESEETTLEVERADGVDAELDKEKKICC